MEADSDDEIDSRDSQQSSDAEAGEHSPFSEGTFQNEFSLNFYTLIIWHCTSEEYGLDETLQPFNSTASSILPPNRKPFAEDCKTYDIVPLVAAIHACHIHSLDATKNMRWVFTGGEDGFIRKYDFFSSMGGKTLLTQNQKHTQVESVQKAGVILSYWENEEIPETLPVTVKPAEDDVTQNVQEPPLPELKMSPVYSLAVQSEAVWLLSGLEITNDETGFVSGSWDKTILHWDLNTGQIVREYPGHSSQIMYEESDNTITHSGDILLTTSIDGNCLVWDKRSGNLIPPRKLPLPEKTPPWCLSACWSADGNKVYCGRRNGTDNVSNLAINTEKYLTYLPHDGFNNQRIALENAIFLAWFLNRTLIIPPLLLFKGLAPTIRQPYDELSKFLSQTIHPNKNHFKFCSRKKNCKIVTYTMYNWEKLLDFTFLKHNIKYIHRQNFNFKYLLASLHIDNSTE
ncbi:15311_t:CDS:2, partial [Racocetra fulgida]